MKLKAIIAVCWLAIGVTAQAEQTIAIDYLVGSDDTDAVRLGYRPWKTDLNQIDGIKDWGIVKWIGDIDVYWEISIAEWTTDTLGYDQGNMVIGFSPVFTHQFAMLADKYPLSWEAGIGVSYLDRSEFGAEDLGNHFQFEDRLGLTLQFGESLKHSATLRYMHYSNGGLHEDNPGVDLFGLSYQYTY